MGRKSCFHCGISDTALWRSGPSEKPTLCNSCGTRWRLKGTLADYIPKHGLIHLETLSETNVKGLPLSIKVPRRNRSVLPHTHIKRLHQKLLEILHELYAEKTGEDGNDLLIDNTSWMTSSNETTSWMISSNETALGAMLLK